MIQETDPSKTTFANGAAPTGDLPEVPRPVRNTRRSKEVTLSDIAARIGVSKVTVSYVLNNRESGVRISEETRQRVRTAAAELGYHPNAVARALAGQRLDTFSLVMQSPSAFQGGSGFMNALMHGVVEAASAQGYDLMLHTKAQPNTTAEVRALTDGRIDGALLLRDRDDPLLAALMERHFPSVAIFSSPDCENPLFVDADNQVGGQIATEYLLELGHTRIGYIGGSPHSSATQDRRTGYHKALNSSGYMPNPNWEIMINYAGEDFSALVTMMNRSSEERPTAFFVWSDDVAAQTMNVLRTQCCLCVPEDVSVIGYDGTDTVGEWGCTPRLTSIRQPIGEITAKGVALLVAQIRKEVMEETKILFAPSLLIRDSCRAVSVN